MQVFPLLKSNVEVAVPLVISGRQPANTDFNLLCQLCDKTETELPTILGPIETSHLDRNEGPAKESRSGGKWKSCRSSEGALPRYLGASSVIVVIITAIAIVKIKSPDHWKQLSLLGRHHHNRHRTAHYPV